MNKYFVIGVVLCLLSGVYVLQTLNAQKKTKKKPLEKKLMVVTSDAFDKKGDIPTDYSCEGKEIFIPLKYGPVPKIAKTIAIIVEDPDAPDGTFVHWVAFNIPASVTAIESEKDVATYDGVVGTNSWDKQSYGPPCPPSGTHRYYFKVYALDIGLALDSDARNTDVLEAMKDHIAGYGELMGKYTKTK